MEYLKDYVYETKVAELKQYAAEVLSAANIELSDSESDEDEEDEDEVEIVEKKTK